jgi:hypothetical protein
LFFQALGLFDTDGTFPDFNMPQDFAWGASL